MFNIIPILKDYSIESSPVSGTDERIIVCPACGRDDHFYFNVKKNLGICHRCKWECNAVAFLMVALNIDRDAALVIYDGHRDTSSEGLRGKVKLLLDEARGGFQDLGNREVFFKNPLPVGIEKITKKKFPMEFVRRHVSYELAVSTGAGICNHRGKYFNRIIFPIKTLRAETFTAITSLSKKRFKEVKELAEKRGSKYRKSLFPAKSFMSEVLCGYNEVKDSGKSLFIVEGIWDLLKLAGYGYNAVGALGTSISKRQAHLLSETKAESLYLMLDGSVPLGVLKKIHKLLSEICVDKEVRVCFLPGGKDPDESSRKEIEEAMVNSRIYLF